MAIGIIGKKLGMTQIFNSDGRIVPVTVIEAGPCKVVQVKNRDKDGYSAIQLGFGAAKEHKVIKPLKGHYAKVNLKPMRYLKEFRLKDASSYESGQDITPSIFNEGEKVSVTGISKGKGFAGSIKRHHFRSGPTSHGSMHHRKPASAGATDAARVFKGKRSPGRMGGDQVTVKGLKVVRADAERNLLLIKGAVPGPTGGLVVIRKASE